MIRLVLLGWLLMTVGSAQRPAVADRFGRLAFLIGKWEGTSEGQPGKGTVRREYARVLSARFVRVYNRSEHPAQPKKPKGRFTRTKDSSASTRRGSEWCSGSVTPRVS
jgi:hypothetical protein